MARESLVTVLSIDSMSMDPSQQRHPSSSDPLDPANDPEVSLPAHVILSKKLADLQSSYDAYREEAEQLEKELEQDLQAAREHIDELGASKELAEMEATRWQENVREMAEELAYLQGQLECVIGEKKQLVEQIEELEKNQTAGVAGIAVPAIDDPEMGGAVEKMEIITNNEGEGRPTESQQSVSTPDEAIIGEIRTKLQVLVKLKVSCFSSDFRQC